MPFTPEALAKRAQLVAIYGWFRQRLVLFLVCALLALQVLTWQAIRDLGHYFPRDPPRCSSFDPCVVELNKYTINQLTAK